ncbi:MAG: isochorismate synthase, partial [Opitutaceae bacterium]
MKRLPLNPSDTGSREALQSFLLGCRAAAAQRGRPQLVSISVEAGMLDPLAVLESIYEPGELHFYCERASSQMAVAGAEAVIHFTPEGEDRFERSRRFMEETLDHTIAVGDLDLPFAGPHFFCGFGFFDRAESESPFSAATVFVPRWQVGRREDRYAAVANLLVAADSPIEPMVDRVWRASGKFRSFEYGSAASPSREIPGTTVRTHEVGTRGGFEQSVETALDMIKRGAFHKIVLARAFDAVSLEAFHPLALLNTLRGRFPDCYAFSFGNGKGQSFIGASPERLVRMRRREVLTEALAGSAPRGRTASEDAAFGAGLLKSEKDLREHALVVDSLIRRLVSLGLAPEVSARPRLRQVSNVQHLLSPITATAPNGLHILDTVGVLHPTPAVGGTPREAACSHIRSLEPFARGLYAGPLGWADAAGGGEFLVGIRSALVDGARARLFAGAGIVEG